ncbi:MAG: hypothetical protein LBE65_06325 [Synergistaceae bacterium]|nr:hypothetical protein [Synergistaceae bacterium]
MRMTTAVSGIGSRGFAGGRALFSALVKWLISRLYCSQNIGAMVLLYIKHYLFIPGNENIQRHRIVHLFGIIKSLDGLQTRNPSGKVLLMIPKRNIETWFEWFETRAADGETVNETDDYKQKHRNAKPKQYGENSASYTWNIFKKTINQYASLRLPHCDIPAANSINCANCWQKRINPCRD